MWALSLLRSDVYNQNQGSSVSVVYDYRLDDRSAGNRHPAEANDFSSSLCVHTSSQAYPASCPADTGGPFPGVKHSRDVTLTTRSHLVPRSRMSRIYTRNWFVCILLWFIMVLYSYHRHTHNTHWYTK
jgi:hypothetical protein